MKSEKNGFKITGITANVKITVRRRFDICWMKVNKLVKDLVFNFMNADNLHKNFCGFLMNYYREYYNNSSQIIKMSGRMECTV